MNRRLQAFRALMDKAGLDGFLVTHSYNRNYLSGFSGSSGALIFGPQKTLFLTDSRYTIQAKTQVKGAEIVLQRRALLYEAAELALSMKVKSLGFESPHVSYADYEDPKVSSPKWN